MHVLCIVITFKTSRFSHCSPIQYTWHSVCNITSRTNKSTQIPATLCYRWLLVCLTAAQLVNKSILNDMEGRHYDQSPPLDRNRSYNYITLTQRDQVAA